MANVETKKKDKERINIYTRIRILIEKFFDDIQKLHKISLSFSFLGLNTHLNDTSLFCSNENF